MQSVVVVVVVAVGLVALNDVDWKDQYSQYPGFQIDQYYQQRLWLLDQG